MRYFNRQTLNRRTANSQTLYVDTDQQNFYVNVNNNTLINSKFAVDMHTNVSNLHLPKGATSDRPVSPATGMIRYNTTTNEVEVYQGSSATWRAIRYKESTGITRETYTGDGSTTVFGPLSIQPPSVVQTGTTWTGDNLIVIVGNVYQTWTANYLIKTGNDIGTPFDAPPDNTQYYIQFTSASPGLSTPIVILHGFDQ
jgi:hypothetical protein